MTRFAHTATIDRAFNQYMSQYDTARMVIFDSAEDSIFTIFFGGISLGVFAPSDGAAATQRSERPVPYADLIQVAPTSHPSGFTLDPAIPFINQITALTRAADGTSQQCVLATGGQGTLKPLQLPERLGTNAHILVHPAAPTFDNGVIDLRDLRGPTLVGYLYGGMRTNDENPTGTGQSFASNRMFKVLVTRTPTTCIAVPRVID